MPMNKSEQAQMRALAREVQELRAIAADYVGGVEKLGDHFAGVTWRADEEGNLTEAVYHRPAETPAAPAESPFGTVADLQGAQTESPATAEIPAETEIARIGGIPVPTPIPQSVAQAANGTQTGPRYLNEYGAIDRMIGAPVDSAV